METKRVLFPRCTVAQFLIVLLLMGASAGCDLDLLVTGASEVLDIPRVVKTQNNYQEAEIRARVPDSVLFLRCCTLYRGVYSDSLKDNLVGRMMKKGSAQGLDTAEARACLEATGQLKRGAVTLPYLAERSMYEGKQAWIFEFAWGMTADDLAHFRCFVMNSQTRDTLLFITCR